MNEPSADGTTPAERPSVQEHNGTDGMTPDGDHRLVEAAIRGDHGALQQLWHTHRRWVAAVLLANKPRDADVDDLLQDVAAQLVAKVGGLREAGAFKPWLRAVALNAAKTAGRKRSVRVAAVLKLIGGTKSDEEPSEPDPATRRTTEEEGRRLMRLASQLPDGYREPLLMRCIQGMGYREIGSVMGLPETTIETRIARGRRMLRELAEKAVEPASNATLGREALHG
jgi:RNA polymerase sigma-70 factor (ECF subfamily)